jgi:short-subunit dehydrogenase
VINASVNGMRLEVHFADYNASKAAVASLAATLAMEWSAGATVKFLLGSQASFLSGATIPVAGASNT